MPSSSFYSRYNPPPQIRINFDGVKGKTKQEFAAEADINNLMKKYEQTGLLGKGGEPVPPPSVVDVTHVRDYQHAMNILVRADTMFSQMSAHLRERFHNKPVELLAFLQDPANRAEAEELGLIQKRPEAPPAPPGGAPAPAPGGAPPPGPSTGA